MAVNVRESEASSLDFDDVLNLQNVEFTFTDEEPLDCVLPEKADSSKCEELTSFANVDSSDSHLLGNSGNESAYITTDKISYLENNTHPSVISPTVTQHSSNNQQDNVEGVSNEASLYHDKADFANPVYRVTEAEHLSSKDISVSSGTTAGTDQENSKETSVDLIVPAKPDSPVLVNAVKGSEFTNITDSASPFIFIPGSTENAQEERKSDGVGVVNSSTDCIIIDQSNASVDDDLIALTFISESDETEQSSLINTTAEPTHQCKYDNAGFFIDVSTAKVDSNTTSKEVVDDDDDEEEEFPFPDLNKGKNEEGTEQFVIPTAAVTADDDEDDDEFAFDLPVPQTVYEKTSSTAPSSHSQNNDAGKSSVSITVPLDVSAEALPEANNAQQNGTLTLEKYEHDEISVPEAGPQHQGSALSSNEEPPGTHGLSEGETKDTDVLQAEAEWDNVQTVTPTFGEQTIGAPTKVKSSSPLISPHEVMQFIRSTDFSQYQSEIVTSIHRSGLSCFKYMLFGPPKLQRDLLPERDLLFCVAACPFENGNTVHLRVLQAIYRRLTGSRFDPPRFGSHWEDIGFQGSDPSTDLRGTGFLSLVQLLNFIMEPKTMLLAREIYKLSLDEVQNFPFCVMGINITRLCLGVLREGSVNKECNRRRNVFDTINEFYIGTYLHLFQIWKQQHKTIADSGFVLKDVETRTKKHSNLILSDLATYLEKRPPPAGTSAATEGEESETLVFTKMSDKD